MELAALLIAEDVGAFNAQRSERSRPELFAVELAEKVLHGADLSNANLEKSDLTGTDLTDGNVTRANLSGIDGSGMKLTDALGLRARFKGAWMDGADLSGADLAQADFAEANLERSTGSYIRLSQARLRGCNATGAVWPDADLSEARLHQAIFIKADLRNADLTGATGAEADLSGATLDGILATEAKFPGANWSGARAAQARLMRINLSGADLSGIDLSAADLSNANLSGANLTGAKLTGAVLADANLDGADLTDADLSGADLTGLEPAELGLSDEVIAKLAAYGVSWDPDAPLVFSDVSVARRKNDVAVVWTNPEGDEGRSIRWAIVGRKGIKHGAVPVPASAVLDLQIAATETGFLIVVLRARPEGVVVQVTPLVRGKLGAPRQGVLGYEPQVKPVLEYWGEQLVLLGLARRGPTLVVHDLSAEEPAAIGSDRVGTAQGFLRGQPVLACKGGVVIPVVRGAAGKPRRTPQGFPGSRGLVAPLPDGTDLLAVWVQPRIGDRPGGLRTSVIGARHAPVAESFTRLAGIIGLDALSDPGGVRIVWAVAGDSGDGATSLRTALLPEGDPVDLEAPEDIREVRTGNDVVALVVAGGGLVLMDPRTGKLLGQAGSGA